MTQPQVNTTLRLLEDMDLEEDIWTLLRSFTQEKQNGKLVRTLVRSGAYYQS